MQVSFHDSVNDELLKLAVIIAKYEGRWVYCKHRERLTYELPGGHREQGETIEDAARRELFEETGAKSYKLTPVCVYSVENDDETTYGMLYYAKVTEVGNKPVNEIEKVYYLDEHPFKQTYPDIQPLLVKEAERRGVIN